MDLINLSEDQKRRLAAEICSEIDSWNTALATLPDRWARNEDIYNLVPGTTRQQAIEGLDSYEIALARPKIDRVVGSVTSSVTQIYPYVQCLNAQDDGKNDEDLEKTLHEMARRGGFVSSFRQSVLLGCLTNLGVMRISFNEKLSCKFEWIHPSNFMCYPVEFGVFKDAKTVGHRLKRMVYKLQDEIDEGEYYKVNIKYGDDAETDYDVRSKAFRKTETTPFIATDDQFVTLYDVVHETDIIDGEYKRYQCVVCKEAGKLLGCWEYPYSKPNYFPVKLTDDGGRILSQNSLAQSLQGVQLAYSDTFSLLLQGGYMAAFPMTIITGGSLNQKMTKYGPAYLIESPHDLKVQRIDNSMNPNVLPNVIQKLEEVADTITGISRLGTGADMKSGTTATAASGFLQAQQEAKDQYTDTVSQYVADMFEFLHELLVLHFEDVTMALGSRIPQLDYEQVSQSEYVYEVTGQSGASNPQVLVQKLMFLLESAKDPNSNLDISKVYERILQSLELPFSTQGLQKQGPNADEMKAILLGLMTGELTTDEAAQMIGFDPASLQQLMAQHEASKQTANSGVLPQPGMGMPESGLAGAQGGPPMQPEEPQTGF